MQMTQELTVFTFNEHTIRRVPWTDGRILYCIADVCAALGLKKSWRVIARLTKGATKGGVLTAKESTRSGPLNSKGAVNNPILYGKEPDNNRPLNNADTGNNCAASGGITWIDNQTVGGVQRMAFTDEVGLYDIISKSRKPLSKILFRRLIEAVPVMRQERASPDVVPASRNDLARIEALTQDLICYVLNLTGDVAHLKTGQEVKALLPVVPPLTRRNEIILLINKYMANHPGEFTEFEHIWNHLYDAFRLRTGRNIKREARPRFKSALAYVQYVGEIDRLWVVAKDLFDK